MELKLCEEVNAMETCNGAMIPPFVVYFFERMLGPAIETDIPDSIVVRTPCLHPAYLGSIPGWGVCFATIAPKILHKTKFGKTGNQTRVSTAHKLGRPQLAGLSWPALVGWPQLAGVSWQASVW